MFVNKPLMGWNTFGENIHAKGLRFGMNGRGNVGLTGCTAEEYRMHFSYWALLNSPLMIGCDIRNMDEETKKTLLNKDAIAINQDAWCQPFVVNNCYRKLNIRGELG